MFTLATAHWSSDAQTRLTWCRDTIVEYFIEGGKEKALAKDARRTAHLAKVSEAKVREFEGQPNAKAPPVEDGSKETGDSTASTQPQTNPTEVVSTKLLGLDADAGAASPHSPRVRVLDVGSCYDPFSQFDDVLDVTAIDLCPAPSAPSSVLACDFLTIPIKAPPFTAGAVATSGDTFLPTDFPRCERKDNVISFAGDGRTVEALHAGSCDAVVFCLLLSYMPTPEMRAEACRRALAILRVGGLLVVVTPDSSHVGKAAARMKRWKTTIESLGFRRWRYSKLKHTHCMAFRAVGLDAAPDPPDGVSPAELASGIVLQCEL